MYVSVGAQVFQASMFVYEEKIMNKYTVPPLQVVGLEGAFGILFGFVLLTFLHYFKVENPPAAFNQMTYSTQLSPRSSHRSSPSLSSTSPA